MKIARMRYTVILILCIFTQCATSLRSSLSDSPCSTPRLKNGRIRARGRGRIIRYSCYADYELVGNKYSTCVRGQWDTPTPICVSTRCPAIPAPKHAVVGEKYRGAILMYFCEPGYVLVGNAEIYCDGRQWNGSTPMCRDSNAVAPTSCDFEKEGLCWWEQDPKHDFDWIRHRFDTPSSHIGTGPTHDHTLGASSDGYYLYIEASGKLINDTARILSPLYSSNLTESGCFSFWYHMYGATIGSLNIYFKPETEKTPKLMWTTHGNQGNQWLRGLFSLPAVNSSFQIIIEGVRGSSYVSDIAVDDVAILQGDECLVKNITVNVTPVEGDEVEVFNAMQTCRDRCVNILETTPSSEVYSNPDACQCTIDCADTGSCCPDYAEFCTYEVTEPMETIGYSNKDASHSSAVISSTEQVTRVTMTVRTTSNESTIVESVTSKATIDKIKSTEPSVVTETTRITKSIPPSVETAARTRPTIKVSTISSTTLAIITDETPFVPPVREAAASTDKARVETEVPVYFKSIKQPEESKGLSVARIIGIIIYILIGFTTLTVIILIIRKRKLYNRGCNGSAFSEDSDVRFLTSDEQLDFCLARPTRDYGEM